MIQKQTDWSKLQSLYKGYKEGVTIIREGQRPQAMYILVSGRLSVFKKGVRVSEVTKRGEYMGEISNLLGIPSSAAVKSDTPVTLIEVEAERVFSFLRHSPDIAIGLAAKMADRLAQLNANFAQLVDRSYKPDLVKKLQADYQNLPSEITTDDPLDYEKLKSLHVEIPAKTTLIEQGTYPTSLYILVKGTIEIIKNHKMIAVEDKPGYYIGDVSILRGTSANASVRTRTNSTFIQIPISKVEHFLNHSPDIAISIAKKLAERTLSLNELFLSLQYQEVKEIQEKKSSFTGPNFDDVLKMENEIYELLGIDPNTL